MLATLFPTVEQPIAKESKDNVNNCCNICYSYEATVIFLPCYHKSCISCSIKINKCHICRHQIESRKYIY